MNKKARSTLIKVVTLIGLIVITTACSSTYYGALAKIGIEKRDILVDRIDDARDSQEDAKEQFSSALEQFRSVIDVDGGDLEKIYDQLNSEYERSERRATEVRDRINSVENVADDLFEEWEDEIEEYSNKDLARQSRKMLRDTQADYAKMLKAMRKAEQSMPPVLTLFKDQVLFLRHNLNARAINSLKGELANIEKATSELVKEMERSINEANRFIDAMNKENQMAVKKAVSSSMHNGMKRTAPNGTYAGARCTSNCNDNNLRWSPN